MTDLPYATLTIPDGWNRKGLVSETGVRKQAFGVLADYYRRKATPAP